MVVLSSAAEKIGNLEFGDLNYKSRSMKTFTIGILPIPKCHKKKDV